ncbi:MAG: hypothetical protein GY856_04920 [bacterium]|nr:hypothetical protein [bacterium]
MRWLAALGVIPALALLAACASSVPQVTESHIAAGEEPYLTEPLRGYPLTADVEFERRVTEGYGLLKAGGSLLEIAAGGRQLLEVDPGFHPARVLLAQVEFVRRNEPATVELLLPVAAELPEYLACQLLLGRAAENTEDLPLAFRSYRQVAELSAAAWERAAELQSEALEVVFARLEHELGRGRIEDAEPHLTWLLRWAPDERRTLEAERLLAVATGDPEAELAAVRRLAAAEASDEILERLGDLELEIGDVRAGLEQFELLAERYPDDPELAEKIARAKFLWRLELLPPQVQEVAKKPRLSRADFATLLYWLVPEVRYAQVSNPPIATDILDHPRREEILRAMNLGLMSIDRTLHRFAPAAPATRVLALTALLGLLKLSDLEFSCLADVETTELAGSWALACRKAAQCRMIPEPADCLPAAEISGPEALDLFRRCLDLLGSR